MRYSTPSIIAIALATALTGCADSSNPEPVSTGQSTENACMQIAAARDQAESDVNGAMGIILEDPAAAAAQASFGALQFAEATSTVDNERLSAASASLGDGIVQLSEAMAAYATDPSEQNAGAINGANDHVAEELSAIAEICD